MLRRLRPLVLAVLIVGLLAVLVVASRPGPRPTTPIAAAAGQPPPPPAPPPPSADSAAVDRPPAPAAAVAPPAHDPGSVLRASPAEAIVADVIRPRAPARWEAPIAISFKRLKDLYRAFRPIRDFSGETVAELSGAAVRMRGAVMPIDAVPASGRMPRFWLSSPIVVMAGCVFCNPPTMADLVYVAAANRPLQVDREELYRSVVQIEILGRLELGPRRTRDGIDYLFGIELKKVLDE